jgi:hypothetical protein
MFLVPSSTKNEFKNLKDITYINFHKKKLKIWGYKKTKGFWEEKGLVE